MASAEVAPASSGLAQPGWQELVESKKPYYSKRIGLFEQYAQREKDKVEAAKIAAVSIKVILPDGKEKVAIKGVVTPFDVANEISKSLAKKCVVAKVNGDAWDLFRPLEDDCTLSLHSFDDAEGRDVSVTHDQIHDDQSHLTATDQFMTP